MVKYPARRNTLDVLYLVWQNHIKRLGAALPGRLRYSRMDQATAFKAVVCWFESNCHYKTQRLPLVTCVRGQIPDWQQNQVQPSPQGEVDSFRKVRKGLAPLNCSQGRRMGKSGVARGDRLNARSLNWATLLADWMTERHSVDNGRMTAASG